jgi:hypothetical protein
MTYEAGMSFRSWFIQTFWTLSGEQKKDAVKKTRGPSLTVADRDALEKIRRRNWLKKHNPAAYEEAVLVAEGVRRHEPDVIEQIRKWQEIQRASRGLGLDGGKSGDSMDRLIDRLPEMMKYAPGIAAALTGQPIETPPEERRQIEAPKPKRGRPRKETVESTDDEEEIEEDPQENKVVGLKVSPEMAASFCRMNCEGKTPRDAAKFLLSQEKYEAVKGMVEVILKTPDTKLFETLRVHAASTNEPALVNLMAWFESQGQWTLDIAKVIRQAHRVPGVRGKLRAL